MRSSLGSSELNSGVASPAGYSSTSSRSTIRSSSASRARIGASSRLRYISLRVYARDHVIEEMGHRVPINWPEQSCFNACRNDIGTLVDRVVCDLVVHVLIARPVVCLGMYSYGAVRHSQNRASLSSGPSICTPSAGTSSSYRFTVGRHLEHLRTRSDQIDEDSR